jgi:hypothetical protein
LPHRCALRSPCLRRTAHPKKFSSFLPTKISVPSCQSSSPFLPLVTRRSNSPRTCWTGVVFGIHQARKIRRHDRGRPTRRFSALRFAARRACGARKKLSWILYPALTPSARERALGTHWANFATRLTALIIEKRSDPSTERFFQKECRSLPRFYKHLCINRSIIEENSLRLHGRRNILGILRRALIPACRDSRLLRMTNL